MATPFNFRGTSTALIVGAAKSLYSARIFTQASTLFWVKFFDKASAPVLGTDTPVLILPLGPGIFVDLNLPTSAIAFATGIGIAFSGDFPPLDTTPVPGGLTFGNVFYG